MAASTTAVVAAAVEHAAYPADEGLCPDTVHEHAVKTAVAEIVFVQGNDMGYILRGCGTGEPEALALDQMEV